MTSPTKSSQPPDPLEDRTEMVATRKRRFVHLRYLGAANSVCGAMPNWYPADFLQVVTKEEAEKMHRCRRCPW